METQLYTKQDGRVSDDYFVMASECHIFPSLEHISYFTGIKEFPALAERGGKIWNKPVQGAAPREIPKEWDAESLIKDMDRAGIDIGCALRESFMNYSYQAAPFATNGWVMQEIARHPDRLVLEANVGPILQRGVKGAIWEMEYLVKEGGAKLIKVYQPEDIGPLNDPRMWPFYEKAQELSIPLTVHTGLAWCHGHRSKYCHPTQLEDVLIDFPDLKIIAYHLAWPFHKELFAMASVYTNLYVGLSVMLGWFTSTPYRGYHAIGMAMQLMGGADRLIFGLDWPVVDAKACVDYIKNLDMPDELVEHWGYEKLTEKDKRMILGETLANLTGVPIKKVV